MTAARRATCSCLLLAALTADCDGLAPVLCDGGGCGTQASWKKSYQSSVNLDVDILFVVDDTPAMAPFAATLAAGFADVAQTLQNLPQGPPSLHVGFVRAGRCGASTRGVACGVTAPDQFMRSELCDTATNFAGTFDDTFACLADLGTADCAPAQPLAAVSQRLAGAPPAGWENFLRPEAYLMIVIIAGGDDASGAPGAPIPVADVVTFVRSLKPDPYQIMVSAVAPASCAAGGAPPARLVEFVEAFGANGVLVDLCDGRLAPALLQLGNRIQTSIDPACVRAVRDVDPETPGLQADCTFLDWKLQPDSQWSASPIRSCDRAPAPCWRLVPGGYCGGDGYVVDIDRGPDWCFAIPTYVTLECLSCADPNDPACAPAAMSR